MPGTATLHERSELDRAVALIVGRLVALGYPKASQFAVRLAVEEAVSNAFHHGHRGLPAGTPVKLEYTVTPRHVAIAVEDRGPGFNPDAVPDPTLDANLEVPTGRGIMLMRSYMTTLRYNAVGNRVEMVYHHPAARQSRAVG
ncbi:MAG: ATP-binding protein [Phycisphaerales bacterium]